MIERSRNVAGSALHLGKKVVEELAHPTQFLDPIRRRQLFRNGRGALNGIRREMSVIDESIASTVEKLDAEYRIRVTSDGVEVFSAPNTGLATLVFPDTTLVEYVPPVDFGMSHSPDVDKAYRIAGPTYNTQPDSPIYHLPLFGMKKGNNVVVPLKDRGGSEIQHGGFASTDGGFEILDWNGFKNKWNTRVGSRPDTYLVQADWYMDRGNAGVVVARANLQRRLNYNAIGVMDLPEQERRYFTLNSDGHCISHLTADGYMDDDDASTQHIRDLAVAAEIVARRYGALDWRICGLEFYGGGTHLPPSINFTHRASRDMITLRVPGEYSSQTKAEEAAL